MISNTFGIYVEGDTPQKFNRHYVLARLAGINPFSEKSLKIDWQLVKVGTSIGILIFFATSFHFLSISTSP